VNPPFAATPSLDRDARLALRLRAIFECCKWDQQREDHPVLAPYALILDREHWSCVAAMAEQLTCEALAIEHELIARQDLHPHLGLPSPIRRVLREASSGGHGHSVRVMRFDFHFTCDGWKISEVNADVPGGFIESSGFSERMAEYYLGLSPIGNPSRTYAEAIHALAGPGGSIALVHATAYSDDRQVME
jgi:glutathionylspermidine synthase